MLTSPAPLAVPISPTTLPALCSPARVWERCARGDLMLRMAGRMMSGARSPAVRKLALCAAGCARTTLAAVEDGRRRERLSSLFDEIDLWARALPSLGITVLRRRAHLGYLTFRQDAAMHREGFPRALPASEALAASVAYGAAYAALTVVTDTTAAVHAAMGVLDGSNLAECARVVRRHYPTFAHLVLASATVVDARGGVRDGRA